MVQLLIIPPTGNLNSRYFPHSGYLGLTPCIVHGIVRLKHDEDNRPFPAKSLSIAVRCYEARLSRFGTSYTNHILADYSSTLWSKPDNTLSASVAELDHPFRITIPLDSRGFSTANLQEYKVFWRVEAVLEHLPIVGVGSRLVKHYDLPLFRYDNSAIPPAARMLLHSPDNMRSAKLRTSVLRYSVSTPSSPIGPEDLVSNCIYLQPLDPLIVVRSAFLTIERRLNLHHSSARTTSRNSIFSDLPLVQQESSYTDHRPSSTSISSPPSSLSSSSSSIYVPTDPSFRSSLSHHDSSANLIIRSALQSQTTVTSPSSIASPSSVAEPFKVITHNIVGTEVHDFSRDSSGMWKKHITVQWPSRKKFTWSSGETLSSEMATVRFFVRVRLHLSSPSTSSEAIELDERELIVVSTNLSERSLALAHFNEHQVTTLRSRSRSPSRRNKRESVEHPPSSHSRRAHKPSADAKVKLRTQRRPHTSAGPTDNPNLPFPTQSEVGPNSNPAIKTHDVLSAKKHVARPELDLHRDRNSTEDHGWQTPSHPRVPSDCIRDWEAELARIEFESRRSSEDMLGSWGGHKRQKMRANPMAR